MDKEVQLRDTREGETVRTLKSGIEIVRRKKHESIDFGGLKPEKIKVRTGRRCGSKFHSSWDLERIVNWTEEQCEQLGWTADNPRDDKAFITETTTVGVVEGRDVCTICIVKCGRAVHAYPVEDPK